MKKGIYVNYDLGLKGDYETFFTWLDSQSALECGRNSAFMNLELPEGVSPPAYVKESLLKYGFKFSDFARIYVSWLNSEKVPVIVGEFISGGRVRAPWFGFANQINDKRADVSE